MRTIRIRPKDERGLVSFMITVVMMIVISLIVMGFTQVANRNRRQALDRQLSTQAFYAAESGVNDAVSKMNARQNSGQPILPQTDCGDTTYPATTMNTNPLVRYTCVLVNPTVPEIEVSPSTQSATIIPINLVNAAGNPISATRLTFSWLVSQGQNPDPLQCSLPGVYRTAVTETCGYALLRVDLLKYSGQTTPTALAGGTSTFFMQPVRSGAANYTFGDSAGRNFSSVKANQVAASCNAGTQRCTATLQLDGSTSAQRYIARITGLYREPKGLIIDGMSGGTNALFSDVQATVDVTGKAQDVLRRVKVRVPLRNFANENLPSGGIQSQAGVCKRFISSTVMYVDECTGVRWTGGGLPPPPPPPGGSCVAVTGTFTGDITLFADGTNPIQADAPMSGVLKAGCRYNYTITFGDDSHEAQIQSCAAGDQGACDMVYRQTQEQFYFQVLRSGGTELYRSPTSQDVPANVGLADQSSRLTLTGSFTMPATYDSVNSLRLVHAPITPVGISWIDGNSVHIYGLSFVPY